MGFGNSKRAELEQLKQLPAEISSKHLKQDEQETTQKWLDHIVSQTALIHKLNREADAKVLKNGVCHTCSSGLKEGGRNDCDPISSNLCCMTSLQWKTELSLVTGW